VSLPRWWRFETTIPEIGVSDQLAYQTQKFMEHDMAIPQLHLLSRRLPRVQQGAVLVLALIFLVLLTILAISASGRSLLQERMAGGLRSAQQAEMSAQTALRGAEWKLWTSTSNVTAHLNCGSGIFTACYKYDPANPIPNVVNFRTKQGWQSAGATTYKGSSGSVDYRAIAGAGASGNLAKNPLYMIEDLGVELPPGVSGKMHESGATGSTGASFSSSSRHIYRVTARAAGANENTVRVLESTFAAKSN
jgi:type IV pilus assembly protein PilX